MSDPVVLRLATALRVYSGDIALPLPLGLLFPSSLGALCTVLGLGPLLVIAGLKESREHLVPRILLGCAAVVAVCVLSFGQVQGRFFFEPYLWIVAAGAASAWTPGKRLLFKLMLGQLFIVALVALLGAATLFPGSLTASWRDRVMSRESYCYAETRWLNQVLPPDAVVLTNIRSIALMPRPVLSPDTLFFMDLSRPDELARFKLLAVAAQVNTLVMVLPMSPETFSTLAPGLGEAIAGPKEFYRGVRNPWNRGAPYKVMAFRFNPKMLPPR